MDESAIKRQTIWKKLLLSVMPSHTLSLVLYEFRLFRVRLFSWFTNRRWQEKLNNFPKPYRVNIAPGNYGQEGWINLDCSKGKNITGIFDLRKRIPLPDESAEMVFCEHFLEHLDYYEEVPSFLEECYRVLQKGGVLRIVVPDGSLYLESYFQQGGPEVMHHLRNTGKYQTKMEVINRVFNQSGEHKFAYDRGTLSSVLKKAGFESSVCSFQESQRSGLALDRPDRASESIYVEGLKPGTILERKQVIKRDTFHQNLERYINGGCLSRPDMLKSLISARLPFNKNSTRITQHFRAHYGSLLKGGNGTEIVCIEPYRGNNPHVLKMMAYLEQHLKDDLAGAYVHGSLATEEETSFSDFDALAVVKNDAFESPERLSDVALKLNRARSIMFEFDPLQHHGWFVLTERDLQNYPGYYFPHELFQFTKSLFQDKGLLLDILFSNSSAENNHPFHILSERMIERLKKRDYPRNMFQLKGLLSQFMLLPSLYVQARDKKGIFKKFSFESARKDFSDEEWSVMKDVSSLRESWFYKISAMKRKLFTRPTQFSRFLAHILAPAIPSRIKRLLTPIFYTRMENLTKVMQRNFL